MSFAGGMWTSTVNMHELNAIKSNDKVNLIKGNSQGFYTLYCQKLSYQYGIQRQI